MNVLERWKFPLLTLIGFFLLLTPSGIGQTHVYPKNDARGIPGAEPWSFVFGWNAVEGAVAYEYILTDNPFCFSPFGCPTQSAIVADTFGIGFDLNENWSYYWITRIIFADGDTSAWSNPSSFFAQQPKIRPVISAVPNPNFSGKIQVWLDWIALDGLGQVEISVWNVDGKRVIPPHTYFVEKTPLRIEPIRFDKYPLPIGMYFVRAKPTATDGFVFQEKWIRVVVR